MKARLFIYGASGHGFAMAQALTIGFTPHELCEVIGFIDDEKGGRGLRLGSAPVLSFAEWQAEYLDCPCLIAIGDPPGRARIAERIIAAGGHFGDVYRDRPAHLLPCVTVGEGSYIDQRAYVGPATDIGNHVHVMPMCSVGHDVSILDFSTICPSCTISGHVVVEERVFLGTGTTIVNGRSGVPLVIGRGVRTAAGSVVTRSIRPEARVAGNPARELRDIVRSRKLILN